MIDQLKEEWDELTPLQRGLFGALVINVLLLSNDVAKLRMEVRWQTR